MSAVEYRRSGSPTGWSTRLYRPVLGRAAGVGPGGARLATGSVHRYLGYGFVALCRRARLLVVTR